MKRIALLLFVCALWLTSTAGAAGNKVVKVFILTGQSNMEGHGGNRTIDNLGSDPKYGHLLKKLKNADGSWVVRNDVFVYYKRSRDTVKAPLTVGQGCSSREIGPELMFGSVIGDYYKEPVLLIKTAWGGKDLYCDFRPPSAGKPAYTIEKRRGKEREIGVSYHLMVAQVKDCLANLGSDFPQLKGMTPEITGFVWFQGFNEQFSGKENQKQVYQEYATSYAHLIADLEGEFKLDKLPSVVGEMGTGGLKQKNPLRAAQAAVMSQKSLKGKVAFVKTAQYWNPDLDRLQSEMKKLAHDQMNKLDAQYKQSGEKDKDGKPRKATWGQGTAAAKKTEAYQKLESQFNKKGSHWPCHYWGSARIYCLVGNGLAEAMKGLVK